MKSKLRTAHRGALVAAMSAAATLMAAQQAAADSHVVCEQAVQQSAAASSLARQGLAADDETESGEVEQEFAVENDGDYASDCVPALQFGNAANLPEGGSQDSGSNVISADVDLYAQPGGVGRPIGMLRPDDEVTLMRCREDNWCQVTGGWVWGDFVNR